MAEYIAELQQTVPSRRRIHVVIQCCLGHLQPGCKIGQIRPVLLVVLGIVLCREIIISIDTCCGSEFQQDVTIVGNRSTHVQRQEILGLPDILGQRIGLQYSLAAPEVIERLRIQHHLIQEQRLDTYVLPEIQSRSGEKLTYVQIDGRIPRMHGKMSVRQSNIPLHQGRGGDIAADRKRQHVLRRSLQAEGKQRVLPQFRSREE